jgi:hypothetical protein
VAGVVLLGVQGVGAEVREGVVRAVGGSSCCTSSSEPAFQNSVQEGLAAALALPVRQRP